MSWSEFHEVIDVLIFGLVGKGWASDDVYGRMGLFKLAGRMGLELIVLEVPGTLLEVNKGFMLSFGRTYEPVTARILGNNWDN
jgi:hypothetical protein